MCSFSKMQSSELVMCTVPAGRKDGKKVKGTAFDRIVGVGDKAGDEFAALTVLHQVERGKPLERIVAPEFREVWLDLDKRFEEMQNQSAQRATNKERRKTQAERREKLEKMKESATINISAASRQVIEDALLEQKASSSKAHSGVEHVSESFDSDLDRKSLRVNQSLKDELIGMGFSEFDAFDAGQRFSTATDAIDYLCLNLDEAELPPSFAPTSDVEVVRFYSGAGKQSRGLIEPQKRDLLIQCFCLSKHATEKALRMADGEFDRAAISLYNTLTHNLIADHIYLPGTERLAHVAEEEKIIEAESISAIYGQDVIVGVGVMPCMSNKWAVVVRVGGGVPCIGSKKPLSVAFVDVDGFYPISAPLIVAGCNVTTGEDFEESLSASQRRLLMRAAAGQVATVRDSHGAGNSEEGLAPIPIIHAVLAFFADANSSELIASAAARGQPAKATELSCAQTKRSERILSQYESSVHRTQRVATIRENIGKPMLVTPVKQSPKLAAMTERRAVLPAHNARTEILAKVRGNQVVVVSGATGSGKTTQVPQFLLEEAAEKEKPVSIVCTQPRRIAAISVAERVAAERCEQVGGTVGYQVKLNTKRSANTRLLFCTTGVLLRRLQGDPKLDSFTHVLVDEVHERSVETDFLLLLLREIAPKRSGIRIVLMSATLDAEKFSGYFSSALLRDGKEGSVPIVSIPGRTFPVDQYYLLDAIDLCGYKLKAGDRYAKRSAKGRHAGKYGPEPTPLDLALKPKNTATAAYRVYEEAMDDERHPSEEESDVVEDCNSESASFSEYTVNVEARGTNQSKETLALIDESIVNVDLIDLLVKKIDEDGRKSQQNGAILIFLPGVAEISTVIKKLSIGASARRLWPLPLHSLLSPGEQSRVFLKPPEGLRKIICATNIAETSITVEDITVVIDTLRAKEMGYDALNRSSILEECFISQAAAKQRAGRAGRVSRGTCYRLVRKSTFENRISPQQKPEIQRVTLEQLVLHMLSIIPDAQSQNDPYKFLGKAVDPPDAISISTAVTSLIDIGALRKRKSGHLDSQIELTALGRLLVWLPVDARIGKLLIFGSLFGCVDVALTIAATISERSPFYSPFDKREEARAARGSFAWGKSDLLTQVKAFNAWRELQESGASYSTENKFCARHFLARKTLISIGNGRKQLADVLADAGFGLPGEGRSRRGWDRDASVNQFGENVRVLKAVLCAALYPNVARIDPPDTTYHEIASGTVANTPEAKRLRLRSKEGERLFLHPESINFEEGSFETRWLAYYAKVRTSRLFIRDSTMVSPYAIMLFGGEIGVQHKKGQMSVDDWVIFRAPARVAVLARELRRELDALLLRKFEDPDYDLNNESKAVKDAIIRLITLES